MTETPPMVKCIHNWNDPTASYLTGNFNLKCTKCGVVFRSENYVDPTSEEFKLHENRDTRNTIGGTILIIAVIIIVGTIIAIVSML